LKVNTTLGTEIEIPTSVGDTLNIYGAKATHAYKVTVPFCWYLQPAETSGNPDTYEVDYTYQFNLPSQAVESYSGLALNLTLGRSPDTIEHIYLNGEDLMSLIIGKTAEDTVTLKTGLVPDTDYTLLMRVRYTVDEYLQLFREKAGLLYWITHPWALVLYAIGLLLAAIGWTRARGKKLQAKALPRRH